MIENALVCAFPSVASFFDFKENDREISRRAIPAILQYAFDRAVIEFPSEEAFVSFLKKKGVPNGHHHSPAPDLTFSEVLKTLVGSLSVNALIAQMEVIARELGMPAVGAPMITRLKKRFVVNTPKKRALMRIMAFKLGQKHPDLNWNYDLLLQLPEESESPAESVYETAGVTVTFHLEGEGAAISMADVGWLKNELSLCLEYLKLENHIHKKVLEPSGATSFNLKAPKRSGAPDEPTLYNEAVRNVMAIAHQMAARWLLSGHSSPKKKLMIIIHAGLFVQANPAIQRILELRLNNESGIYLTDFARLCALYASVKAAFELYAPRSYRATGSSDNIWFVSNFLSHHYYDLIPCLLDGKMMPRSLQDPSYEDFKKALHFPEQAGYNAFGAIAAMHRFPQNALLLTEIAKVLRVRQMFYDADIVLSHLLLSSPLNIAARLMRMLIYSNIAQSQKDYDAALLAFERARSEGDFIVRYCEPESDIWQEIGVQYFSQAVKFLQFYREKSAKDVRQIQKDAVIAGLRSAKEAFIKSMTVSATGKALNALYMFGYTLCLEELLLKEDQRRRENGKSSPPDVCGIFKNVSLRVFRIIGWLRVDDRTNPESLDKSFQELLLTINLFIARYENLVLCRSDIPHIKYMFALILWDFAPRVTLQLCRITLGWLKIARQETEKLLPDNISVYHPVCGNISAEKFLVHLQETMDAIYSHISETDLNDETESPATAAKLKGLSHIKLMLLELDRSHTKPFVLRA